MQVLFEPSLVELMKQVATRLQNKKVVQLMQEAGTFTGALKDKAICEIDESVVELSGINLLPANRKVCIPYGPVLLQNIQVSSLTAEIVLRILSAFKYIAAVRKLLPRLPNEEHVVSLVDDPCIQVDIDEEFLNPSKRCRQHLTELWSAATVNTADDMVTIIKQEDRII